MSEARAPHPLRCHCGKVQGQVEHAERAHRAVCYCSDCQAFARALGQAETVLDAQGGTEIIAVLPANVHFSKGAEAIACLSLSPRGLLRWYAECCSTPIGNTPRDHKLPYVGLIHSCLGDAASLRQSFGESKMRLNTESAIGSVPATPALRLLGILQIMRSVITARLRGAYRINPFFAGAEHEPLRAPRVLSSSERAQFTRHV